MHLIIEKEMKLKARMWDKIIGYGSYNYKYATGREGSWFQVGLVPRKTYFTLYVPVPIKGFDEMLAELGEIKHGKCCIHIKKLSDINKPALVKMVRAAAKVKTYIAEPTAAGKQTASKKSKTKAGGKRKPASTQPPLKKARKRK